MPATLGFVVSERDDKQCCVTGRSHSIGWQTKCRAALGKHAGQTMVGLELARGARETGARGSYILSQRPHRTPDGVAFGLPTLPPPRGGVGIIDQVKQ